MSNFTTWRSLVDGEEIGEIPDSAIHHWPMDEGSGSSVEDVIGSADGSLNGPSWISNNWEGGYALEGDGVDDYVETTTWGDFGSNLDGEFAVALTIEPYTTFSSTTPLIGADDVTFRISFSDVGAGSGELEYFSRDGSGDDINVATTDRYDDGTRHRVVINKTGNDANDVRIWVDNSDVDQTVSADDNPTNYSNFSEEVWFHGRSGDGRIDYEGVIDNVVVYDSSLSNSEIEKDYNAQPWT